MNCAKHLIGIILFGFLNQYPHLSDENIEAQTGEVTCYS